MGQNDIQDVLDFWFQGCQEDSTKLDKASDRWYGGGAELDQEISDRFGELFDRACSDSLSSWADTADGALALVILLDQFSRNIHRKSAQAFAQDPMARAIVVRSCSNGLDQEMSTVGRLMFYHPLQHSEYLEDQEYGVEVVAQLLDSCPANWKDCVASSLRYFEQHRDIVKQFGRFPHRNKVLGRESSQEEQEYLKTANTFGQ